MVTIETFEQVCDKVRGLLLSPIALLCSIPLIVVWRLLGSSPADPDLFARVAMGRLAISLDYVPLHDPFAFTPTLPTWVDHEWLSGVVFYLIASTCGDPGLVLLKVLLASSAAVCVALASRRYAPEFSARFMWITLCVLHAASAWTSTVRCQAFTYLFLPMLYWAIIEYRKDRNIFALSLTPLLAIAWVNIHGGYALGCVGIALLVGCETLERRLSKSLILIAVGWALAPIFTPYGWWGFVSFLVDSLGMERPGIVEWFPLHTDVPSFIATILLCAPLFVGLVVRKRSGDLFALAALSFSGYCALRHTRFLPFFMITAAIFGAPYVDAALEKVRSLRPTLYTSTTRCGALVCATFMAIGSLHLILLAISPSTYRLDYKSFPIGAVEWLRTQGITGKLLVDFNTGSYALWRVYPNMKISTDGRYEECYPNQTVLDNALAFHPEREAGRSAFERINPTHILLSSTHGIQNLDAAFGEGWAIVYRDPQAVVLAHAANYDAVSTTELAPVPLDMWAPRF
ncbi:MAG: hypothetical protein RIS36_1876 [Pseudomonadota bacterium]|jgi:hypothetical protein